MMSFLRNVAAIIICLFPCTFPFLSAAVAETAAIPIPGGSFTPLYGTKSDKEVLTVHSFILDKHPVTSAQYEAFVLEHPEWGIGKPPPLLADKTYLARWRETEDISKAPQALRAAPVTQISWFAAQAFCEAQGGRLPTVLEWEYVGAASETKRDASRDPAFVDKLLEWYATPAGSDPEKKIGRSASNYYGVADMHGLVWEWTFDFNSVFVSGDNRRDADQSKNLFCGNSVGSATDRANYAAFMRYALRNSLKASYTMENLGFRCAYDKAPSPTAHPRNTP